MNCIDFDSDYAAYAQAWIRQNRARFPNADALEAQMPEVYIRWINTPAAFLDGVAPALYFERYDDARLLVNWMLEYLRQGVPVPDLLLQRIHEMGERAEPELMRILREPERFGSEAAMTAMGLLRELQSEAPLSLYLEWILSSSQPAELLDSASEALSQMGPDAAEAILQHLEEAGEAALPYFADALYTREHDERIFRLLSRLFETGDKALYASYLGRYGDERAVGLLRETLTESGIDYLEFIEIRNAIEALGGDVEDLEIRFDGDPYYETVRRMDGLHLREEPAGEEGTSPSSEEGEDEDPENGGPGDGQGEDTP